VKRTKATGRRTAKPSAAARRRVHRPRRQAALAKGRFHADPEEVERSLAKLVLSLVEFLRQIMERQAVRRMEEGTLSTAQIESMGVALMQLEETLHEMAARFGLRPADLNLDLGPLGRLT
jgi:hypothetical protein